MQPTYTEIKHAGLSALKHRWAEALAISSFLFATCLLNVLMQSFFVLITRVDAGWNIVQLLTDFSYNSLIGLVVTLISAAFSLLIEIPLVIGVVRWFWLVTGGGNPSFSEIFFYFSSFSINLRSIKCAVGLFWRILLALIVCFVPYTIFVSLTTPLLYNSLGFHMPLWLDGIYVLKDIVFFFGMLVFFMICARFLLFFAPMISEPQLSVHQCFRNAAAVSKGKSLHIVCFVLSFFGWGLLCLFVFPLLFVVNHNTSP